MTLADWIDVFEKAVPYLGAVGLGAWLHRDVRKAHAEIAELRRRCQELEVLMTADTATDDDVRAIGYDPDSDEAWELPRPLPPATARYRS